jgi:hypothetical protein
MGRQVERILNEGKEPFSDEAFKANKFRSAKGRRIKKVKFKDDGTI